MTDYLQNTLKSVYMLLKPSAAGCTAFQQTQISQLPDGLKVKKVNISADKTHTLSI